MAEAIFAVTNDIPSARAWQCRSLSARLRDKKILQACGRRRCSESFQKGTAPHNASFRSDVGEGKAA
jgi:hypothetical protein